MTLRVVDLFSGLGGWAAPFREHGHEVITLDIEPSFNTDVCANIFDVTPEQVFDWFDGLAPDIILASPPCETFSTMAMGKNWYGPDKPKTDKAKLALEIVTHTMTLIHEVQPSYFVIENPRAMLRKMSVMDGYDRTTVWYCRYGHPFAKPTDLWGGFPPAWVPRDPCHNGNPDHVAAPRGSRTGTQGGAVAKAERRGSLTLTKAAAREYYGTSNPAKLAALRAIIPYELSYEIMRATERSV